MAESKSLQYIGIDKPLLPYISYTSPINESPHFVQGAQNILGSQVGYLEKRPGFSAKVETALSVLTGTIVRLFTWRRWNASFFIMACTTNGTQTRVYSYEVGVNTDFQIIWLDSTHSIPYDFVVSDNFCFFGNGTDGNMRKFDGSATTKWGCDPPLAPPTFSLVQGNLPSGIIFNSTTGTFSGTPSVSGSFSVTVTVTDSVGATASQNYVLVIDDNHLEILQGSPLPIAVQGAFYSFGLVAEGGTPGYTFTVDSGSLPLGMSMNPSGVISGTPTANLSYSFVIKVTDSLAATTTRGYSIFVSSSAISASPSTLPNGVLGTAYSQTFTPSGGTGPYSWGIVNGAVPPGMTFNTSGLLFGTPTLAGHSNFTVRLQDSAGHTGEAVYALYIGPISLAITDPTLANAKIGYAYSQPVNVNGGSLPYTFTVTAGSLVAQTGYVWGYTYTTIYGHESNMSELSRNSGLFTDQNVSLDLLASSDDQVNGINVYRSTDGGAQDPAIMRLVSSLSNANQTFIDSIQDIFLGNQTGPAFLTNTPPTALSGFIWSNGRIWGKINNETWYTGNEEISNGIAEECMPSGLDGNYYKWSSEVGGMASTPNGVDIGQSAQFWQISGDSLDTFRKSLLLDKGGTRNPTNIITIGNTVFWVDTSKQVWSSTTGEIGEPIRTDLLNIDPTQTFLAYHKSKQYNWLCLLDALNGILLVYDLDLDQWNTPWTVPGMTAIYSGETSLGQINLIAGFSTGHVMQLTPSTYNDDGSDYADRIKTSLMPLMPYRSTTQRNHEAATEVQQFEIELNTRTDGSGDPSLPDYFGALADDDPTIVPQEDWQDLTANLAPMPYGAAGMPKGKMLQAWSYKGTSDMDSCIRAAAWIEWNAAENGWKLYSFDCAFLGES